MTPTPGTRVLVAAVVALCALCHVWVTVWTVVGLMATITLTVSLAAGGGPTGMEVVVGLLVILALVVGGYAAIEGCFAWLRHLRRPRADLPGFPVLPPAASR